MLAARTCTIMTHRSKPSRHCWDTHGYRQRKSTRGCQWDAICSPHSLTSIGYINQLHMQEQVVIVVNHFTYGNGVDKQVFS